MTIDIDTLEVAAKAATPGPWNIVRDPDGYTHYIGPSLVTQVRDDAAYIAAVSPDAVLELIAELRKARAERDWLANDIATKDGNCPPILQDCTGIVCTTDVCKQCWIEGARKAVEKEGKE